MQVFMMRIGGNLDAGCACVYTAYRCGDCMYQLFDKQEKHSLCPKLLII
jgi:hypothetical protein